MADTPNTKTEWADLLRNVGLGAGLHEPLRTKVIETAVDNLAEMLTEYDEKVAEEERARIVQALEAAAHEVDEHGSQGLYVEDAVRIAQQGGQA